MVNRGVSLGCRTCKQRKKKCDETRPACKACVRTKRQCPGYECATDVMFRPYSGTAKPQRSRRQPVSQSLVCATDEDIDTCALEFFVRDYCVRPASPDLSRGYLQSVLRLLQRRTHHPAVAQAARAVTLCSIGTRWNRSGLVKRSQWLYHAGIQAFLADISADSLFAHSAEALAVVTLFGLYELVSLPISGESGKARHGIHASGIKAILDTRARDSLPDIIGKVADGNSVGILLSGLLVAPGHGVSTPGLDKFCLSSSEVLVRARNVFRAAASELKEQDVRRIALDASRVFDDLCDWSRKQSPSWQPICVGYAGQSQINQLYGDVFWPGRVDTYMDVWVAAIWTICRKGSIMLASIASQCAEMLPFDDEVVAIASRLKQEVRSVIDALLASIPYFLLENVEAAFQSPPKPLSPGPPAGAILAMYPLRLLAEHRAIMPREAGHHIHKCLQWIGHWQGIGQAKAMAQDEGVLSESSISSANTIVWAAMAG